MSSRNSKASKDAARERLRAQRAKEAKRAKIRRQFFVGGGVVVVLAIAAGVAVAVNQANKPSKPSYWAAAAKKPLVKPANTSGTNGTTITIGDKNNKNTVQEFEDLRCPICASYEQESGAAVLQGATEGQYKIEYTFGTFLDGTNGGNGSKKSLSALAAALNVSTDAFSQYHTLLYSKAIHPDEKKDDFNNAAHLISVAQKVPALKGNTKFSDAVNKGTFDKWALDMSDQFNSNKKVTGTPTVFVNGKTVSVNGVPSATVVSSIQADLTK
jgi:protein-disulfide isomerase